MEQHSLRTEYKVGVFVAMGLLTVMVSILLLGGNRIVFTKYLKLHVYFSEVQGLFPGSVVSLQGLPIGNVKHISFTPDGSKLDVELDVDRIYQDRITEGSLAEIRTQGALGDKYIFLTPGPNPKPLQDGAVIAANEGGDILKMLTDKDQGVGRVLDLIKELHILIATFNANGRTAGFLDNLNQATAQFKTTLTQLNNVIEAVHDEIPRNKKLRDSINSLASIMEKIDKGQGTLGQLINDPSIHQSLKAFLGNSPRQNYLKNVVRESIQQSEIKK